MPSTTHRNKFSDKEDDFLVQYIAKYNPQPEGRTGNKLYERLVENAEGKWPWHRRHTWQSWRERYRTDKEHFDRRIAIRLRAAAKEAKAKAKVKADGSAASAPASPPLPPPPPPQSRSPEKRERVPYTMEDDDNLAEYLAANSLSHKGRQGKNLYEAIADEPWGERHPWQSWHERYKKNHAYFDQRIRRIHAGEDDDEDDDEEDIPRPRTVDGATRYSLSQARAHAKREKERVREKEKEKEQEQEKRKRGRERESPGEEAPPRKKTRVEQPVAGPSGRREPEVVEVPSKPEAVEVPDEPEVGGAPDGQEDEGPQDGEEQAVPEDEVHGEGGEEQDEEEQDEPGEGEDNEDEDEDEDEEERGPIGSDDYCGAIFDEPEPEAEAEGQDGPESESESDREQEEAELMLSDDPFADAQDMDEAPGDDARADVDADVDVDMGGDETVVVEAGDAELELEAQDEKNPFDDAPRDVPIADQDEDEDEDGGGDGGEAEPHLSTTPPSGASPPARPHNARIEHDIDAQPDTPELSPAEDANARHRREHGHEPAPARKHATRILRKRGHDEDFFGTPSASASAQNSPTAARHAARKPACNDDEGGSPQKRQREPPRLDEGAWNTAFSDARGRTRASPKRPRRSGVEFDFEVEDGEAQEVSDGEGERGGAEEEVDASPAQWPPVRGQGKGKAKVKEDVAAPTTPARSARDKGKAREVIPGAGEGRVVTTEHILSVKTIRTVERRPANGVAGAGAAVEAAREPAADQPSSPRTLVQEDEDEMKAEPTARHPFSQLEPRVSRSTASSRGSSVFPRVDDGAKDRDSRKEDIARMQKMLATSRGVVAPVENGNDQDKGTGKDKDKKRRALVGASSKADYPGGLLRALANGGGTRNAGEVFPKTTRRMFPAGTIEDASRRRLARFQEREESLPVPEAVPPLASSPLARRGSNSAVDQIVPHASTSRVAQGAPNVPPPPRVDKGKGKARAGTPSSGAGDGAGQSRRHTTSELEANFKPLPREQSTVVRHPRHVPRPSLPAVPSFPLGEDPFTALSFMFHPPPSGANHSRVYSLPSHPHPSLSSGSSSANPPLYAPLPAHERAMVKELGVECMLAAMARNHGFSTEVAREVCAKAGSMERTDRVLRDMRKSANRQANVTFREMLSESEEGGDGAEEDGEEEGVSGEDGAEDEEEDDEEPEDAEDAEEDAPAQDGDAAYEGEELPDSSAEVESVLGQDANSWLDDAPQAESSRIRGGAAGYSEDGMDVDVDVSHIASSSMRKPFRIKMLPKEPAQGGVVYSPPKKTRASRFIKKAQKAEVARGPQRGQDAMDVDAHPFGHAGGPVKPRYASLPVGSIGQLSKYGAEEWLSVESKYGPGAAKMMMGKALAKLLPAYPQ